MFCLLFSPCQESQGGQHVSGDKPRVDRTPFHPPRWKFHELNWGKIRLFLPQHNNSYQEFQGNRSGIFTHVLASTGSKHMRECALARCFVMFRGSAVPDEAQLPHSFSNMLETKCLTSVSQPALPAVLHNFIERLASPRRWIQVMQMWGISSAFIKAELKVTCSLEPSRLNLHLWTETEEIDACLRL